MDNKKIHQETKDWKKKLHFQIWPKEVEFG
jgi:hypothetical protein